MINNPENKSVLPFDGFLEFRLHKMEDGPLYGKILNDFEYGLQKAKTVRISFSYYLNPDGTRNMEFDPKRNLFKSLKSLEEIREP